MHTRHILATSVLSILAPCLVRGDVLDRYNFGPDTQTNPTPSLVPTTVDPNANATNISAGVGLTLDPLANPGPLPASAPYLRTTTVANTTTAEAAAVTANSYFTFTLNANTGFLLNLVNMTIDAWRGGTSLTRGFALRSSVDNFTGDLFDATGTPMASIPGQRPTATPYNFNLTAAAFQNLTTITFRFYVFANTNGSSVEFDNVVLNGTSAAISLPPPNGYLWTGTSSNVWNTTAVNWTGSGTVSVPSGQYVEGADVIFDSTGTNTNPISVAAPVHPNSVLLSNTIATPYSFTGSSVTATGAVTKIGNGLDTFSNSLNAASIVVSAGTMAIATGGSVTTPSLTVSNGATFTLANGATLDPATNFTLTANATLNVPAQTLATLSGDTNGILTLNGTALNITGTSTYNGKITGSGSVIKNTAGTLTLGGGNSDFTGGLSVTGPGAVVLAGLNPAGTQPVTATANAKLVLGAPANTNVNSNIVLNSSTLGATGVPQTLKGSLTLNGPTTLASFNVITGTGNADLQIDGQLIAPTNPNITILQNNGTAPETAAVRFRGPASAYAGTITMGSAGKIELLTAAAAGSPIGTGTIIMSAGTIGGPGTPNNSQVGTYSLINLRNNFVSVPAGTPTTANLGNNIQVTGTGTVIMNLLGNTVAGSTTVLGDLQIGDNQSLVAASTASAVMTLQFNSVHLTGGNATFTPGYLNNTINSSYVVQDNIALGPISENVAGSGIITNGGAKLTLTGNNTYTGPTSVQSGTLVLAAGSSISSSSAVTIASGAKIDATALGTMTVPSGHTVTVSGTLDTNVGGVIPGTLDLSGTLRGSGDGFANGVVKATVLAGSGSTIAPGISGPGLLAGQNLDLLAGSNFVVDVSKVTPGLHPNPGTDYDQFTALDFSGGALNTVHIAGNLAVNVGTGLEIGDVFTIIANQNFDSISGTFNGLPDGAVFAAGGQFFQISYGDESFTPDAMEFNFGNDVSLQVVVPEPSTALLLLGGFLPLMRRRARRSTERSAVC